MEVPVLQATAVNAPAARCADARHSPDGTLWVVDSSGNTISGFPVDGGSLTELPNSPAPGPVEAEPVGLVVT